MALMTIYRSEAELTTVHIGDTTVYRGVVMASDKVSAKFDSPVSIAFLRGDYIIHNGQQYRLDRVPELQKSSSFTFSYSAEFEHVSYRLYDRLMRHLDSLTFSFFATPATILQLIVDNINVIDPGWTIAAVDNGTEGKLLQFNGMDCMSALSYAAKEFDLEFSFSGKAVSLIKSIGAAIEGLTLSYGQGNGLYTLTRKNTESRIFTRFVAIGGSQNLPEGYRGGIGHLSFDGGGYIDRNTGIYGIVEMRVPLEHIFPKRTATITATPSSTEVIDTTINFNLGEHLIKGQSKILFKSGDLAGNEFEIVGYDHATKKIRFEINKDEDGYQLPNSIVKPEVGDLYTFIGIPMPESYVDSSEDELFEALSDYADIHQDQLNAYDLAIDEEFIRQNGWSGMIWAGDRVHTEDDDLNLDALLRIQEISYPLSNPARITAVLSDQVIYTVAEKIIKSQVEVRHEITNLSKTYIESQRIAGIRRQQLQDLVFDTDGYFDAGNIKPLSINTSMLTVGAKSQQFQIPNITFDPNYQGNPSKFTSTAGTLVHFAMLDSAVKTWSIPASSFTGLVGSSAYYIYAKCQVVGAGGTILLSEDQIQVGDDPNYYHFLIGVLHSEI